MSKTGWRFDEEKEVRASLCQLAKDKIMEAGFLIRGTKDAPADPAKLLPIKCSLELGLRILLIMDELDAIDDDLRRKLVDRINVVMRATKPMGMALEVSQIRGRALDPPTTE